MVDIGSINWIESQNAFSISSRRIFGRNISYNYYKDHQKKSYWMGRYRYCVNGEIKMSNVDKKLQPSGIESDGKAYYWHYFHNSCCFAKQLNYDLYIALKNNRFIVNRVNSGKWNFNHNAFSCITRAITELELQLSSNQHLVVLLPWNKNIEKEAQKKYQNEFIELLKQEDITYVVGDINKVDGNDKQLVVVVIDLVTTINRKNYIINDIRKKKVAQKPLIAMYSLVVIYDEIVGQFSVDLHVLREKQEEEKRAKKSRTYESWTPDIDEEELIMRSLAGYGPDPEIFGF